MADTKKRLSGDYTISTPTSGTITLDTGTLAGSVVVTGNLVVHGIQTTVESTTTTVVDPVIQLNQGESGAGVTTGKSGIEVVRGTQTNVQMVWNETLKCWQISNAAGTFSNIAYTNGSFLPSLGADPAPTIGGNLNLQSYSLWSNTSPVLYHNGNLAISTTAVAPSAITNNVVVYASTVSGGGSGLYTSTANGANELATKSAAIKYSIIFG